MTHGFIAGTRRALGISLLLFLAACASTSENTAPPAPRPARESIVRFEMQARAAIRTPQRAETVRLQWQHGAGEDAIGFATPLGNIVAELQRDALGARWLTADGERYDARSADQLMARLTDVPVPLDALALWVTGRTSSAAQAVKRDAQGRLLSALDGGWEISVPIYESDSPNALPQTVEAIREGLRIRLAIENWQL